MRPLLALLSFLWLAPPAFADCANLVAADGSSVQLITRSDRRALEALLGTQVEEVVCGFMQPARRFALGPKRGFFALTADEVAFVGDRKTMEILFRTKLSEIVGLGWGAFTPPGWRAEAVDWPVGLTLATNVGAARFELPCANVTRRLLNELQQRTLGNPGLRVSRPPGSPTQDACR